MNDRIAPPWGTDWKPTPPPIPSVPRGPGNPAWRDADGNGVSGNPAGRPPGRPDKRLLATQAALDEIKNIVQMLVGRALEGDVNAASILLAKVLPSVKAQTEKVAFDFDATAPISEQVAAVLQAVSEGKLAADVGRLICDSIGRLADVKATEELAARIEALEEAADARK